MGMINLNDCAILMAMVLHRCTIKGTIKGKKKKSKVSHTASPHLFLPQEPHAIISKM